MAADDRVKLAHPRPAPGGKSVPIQSRAEIRRTQRGHTFAFLEGKLGPHPLIVNKLGQTIALSNQGTTLDASNGVTVIPRDATCAIIVADLSSNAASAGLMNLNFFADEDSRTLSGIANAVSSQPLRMESVNMRTRQQHIVPLNRRRIMWETTQSGVVDFDLLMYLVGWVLE